MRKAFIILGAILSIILIGIGVWLALRSEEVETPSPTSPEFPLVGSDSGANGDTQGGGAPTTITIPAFDNQSTEVLNFLDDPDTHQDPINEGYYYLGSQPSATGEPDAAPYHISYLAETSHFNITLREEPIGDVRRSAEQFLKAKLGISEELMCTLDYTVSVPYSVNATFSSSNLGFSFCPGAVVLP